MSTMEKEPLHWPRLNPRVLKNIKDTIPLGSNDDVGRRVIRREITGTGGTSNNVVESSSATVSSSRAGSSAVVEAQVTSPPASASSSSSTAAGWGHIGVVIEFVPMEELYIDRAGAVVDGEMGEEISLLQKAGYVDNWKVLYGNGQVQLLDAVQFIHGLQLYSKCLSSGDVRNQLQVDLEMLDVTSTPTNFLQSAAGALTETAVVANTVASSKKKGGVRRSVGRPPKSTTPTTVISATASNAPIHNLLSVEGGNNVDNGGADNITGDYAALMMNTTSDHQTPAGLTSEIRESADYNTSSNTTTADADVDAADQVICEICHSGLDEDKLLLCDKCELGYHIYCLTPPLRAIPKGNFNCPNCVEVFECSKCQKKFKTKGGYKYHMERVCNDDEEMNSRNRIKYDSGDDNNNDGNSVRKASSSSKQMELSSHEIDPKTGRTKRKRKVTTILSPSLKGGAKQYNSVIRKSLKDVDNSDDNNDDDDDRPVAKRSGFKKPSNNSSSNGKKNRNVVFNNNYNNDEDEDEDAYSGSIATESSDTGSSSSSSEDDYDDGDNRVRNGGKPKDHHHHHHRHNSSSSKNNNNKRTSTSKSNSKTTKKTVGLSYPRLSKGGVNCHSMIDSQYSGERPGLNNRDRNLYYALKQRYKSSAMYRFVVSASSASMQGGNNNDNDICNVDVDVDVDVVDQTKMNITTTDDNATYLDTASATTTVAVTTTTSATKSIINLLPPLSSSSSASATSIQSIISHAEQNLLNELLIMVSQQTLISHVQSLPQWINTINTNSINKFNSSTSSSVNNNHKNHNSSSSSPLLLRIPNLAVKIDDNKGASTVVRPFEGVWRGHDSSNNNDNEEENEEDEEENDDGVYNNQMSSSAASVFQLKPKLKSLSSSSSSSSSIKDTAVDNTTNNNTNNDNDSKLDYFLNTGGPIWDIAFAPSSTSIISSSSTLTTSAATSNSNNMNNSSSSTSTEYGVYDLNKNTDRKEIVYEKFLAVGLSRINWPEPPSPPVAVNNNNSNTTSSINRKTTQSLLPATCTGQYGFAQDSPHVVGKSCTHPNLLQIWCITQYQPLPHAETEVSKRNNNSNNNMEEDEAETVTDSMMMMPVLNYMGMSPFVSSYAMPATTTVPSSSSSTTEINSNKTNKAVNNTNNIAVAVTLSYCVGLKNRGPVWKVAWNPHDQQTLSSSGSTNGISTSSSGNSNNDNSDSSSYSSSLPSSSPLLGLLAIVCGDGSCLILALPTQLPAPLSSGASSSNSSEDDNNTNTDISDNVRVIPENAVCKWEIGGSSSASKKNTTNNNSTASSNCVMCVSWHPVERWRLCCGMLDGSVTIWDLLLSSTSSSYRNSNGAAVRSTTINNIRNTNAATATATATNKTKLIHPLIRLTEYCIDSSTSCLSAINSIQFCPYQPDLIATGGYDSVLKIWNIKSDLHKPVFTDNTIGAMIGWIYEIQWDPYGWGLFSGGSDQTGVYWSSVWERGMPVERKIMYSHQCHYAGIWKLKVFAYDQQAAAVSVASNGSVRCSLLSNGMFLKGKIDNVFMEEFLRVKHVSTVATSSKKKTMANQHHNYNDDDEEVADNDDDYKEKLMMGYMRVDVDTSFASLTRAYNKRNGINNNKTNKINSKNKNQSKSNHNSANNYDDTSDIDDDEADYDDEQATAIPSPTFAIHAIDSCPVPSRSLSSSSSNGTITNNNSDLKSKAKNSTTTTIFAYGGATGILRIHTKSMKQAVIG